MPLYGMNLVSRIDKLRVSFAKEPYKRDDILQKRPIYSHLLIECEFVYGVNLVSRIDKLRVSFAKKPYKRDDILQKRPLYSHLLIDCEFGTFDAD